MNVIDEAALRFSELAEQNEIAAWRPAYQGDKDNAVRAIEFDGVFCGAMNQVDILAFNRAQGLGLKTPISDAALMKIIEFYKQAGVGRFFLSVSPKCINKKNAASLKNNGFLLYNHWVKLYRQLSGSVAPVDTRVAVRQINPDEGSLYGKLIVEAFDWPETLGNVFSRTVGQSGYVHFFAEIDKKPIAAGALYMDKFFASMVIAGTLAPFRGLGAQSALLARRLETATGAGCRFIFAETAREHHYKPVPSYRNMVRFGFRTLYLRPNYIYYFSGLS